VSPRDFEGSGGIHFNHLIESSKFDLQMLKDLDLDGYIDEDYDQVDEPHANPNWHNRAFSSFLRGELLTKFNIVINKSDIKKDI
jgi:hypothetical protein